MVAHAAPLPPDWPDPSKTEWGYFHGLCRSEWLADGRLMKLCGDFTFVDRRGVQWVAREGLIFDGASKPQFTWRSGGPYEGKYRRAAVIHDQLYHERIVDRKTADVVFYEGMRADGVCWWRAKAYYLAVRWFGPRWAPKSVDDDSLFPKWSGDEPW